MGNGLPDALSTLHLGDDAPMFFNYKVVIKKWQVVVLMEDLDREKIQTRPVLNKSHMSNSASEELASQPPHPNTISLNLSLTFPKPPHSPHVNLSPLWW